MATWVALLRAVNLGPTNRVAMPALREALERNGFANPRSYAASGNVIVSSPMRSAAKVAESVAVTVEQVCGKPIDVIVRSESAWRELVKANPFPDAALQRPAAMHAYVLSTAPPTGLARVQERLTEGESVELIGDVLYVDHAQGVQASTLSGAFLSKALGVQLTARNWRTVLTIESML